MQTINFDIRDALTGKETLVRVSIHDANQLYKALNELFGDSQFGAKAGELVTVPTAEIRV